MPPTKKTAPATPPPAPQGRPAPTAEAPKPTTSTSASVGRVVSYQLDEDGPTLRGLVVAKHAGDEHRDDAVELVPLTDTVTIPADSIRKD